VYEIHDDRDSISGTLSDHAAGRAELTGGSARHAN
jgi:hypothetical protein